MNWDFSHLNLEYLIQARDLAIEDQGRASAILGIPDAMAGILPDLTPQLLANITRSNHPLVTPRQDVWWWSRLLVALQDGQPAEIETVMAHALVIPGAAEEKRNQ